MKKYARLFEDGRVIETHWGDPSNDFVAEIAAQFVEVPDDTKIEDKKTADGWEKYVEPEPPAAAEPVQTITTVELKAFFTRAERLGFKAAQSDPIIEDFAEMLTLRPQDLAAGETIEAIDKLAELNVLTTARAQELKDLEV